MRPPSVRVSATVVTLFVTLAVADICDTNRAILMGSSFVRFAPMMAYCYIESAQHYIRSLGFTNVNTHQQAIVSNGITTNNSLYSRSLTHTR